MIDKSLEAYGKSDIYPFHMPGHKRREFDFENPYHIDITEITGFDNLHNPTGQLQELEEHWAKLYGAKKAYLMINGSTGGILSAIFAALEEDEELLLARNCHKSAYNGAYLKDVNLHFIYPDLIKTEGGSISGEISPKNLEKILKDNPNIGAFLFTSPTYEGIISNIEELSNIAHSYGVKVIVDAAHGAHFGLCGSSYENPVTMGADLVVVSLHKTLPAFTSTAMLLQSHTTKIKEEKIRFYLDCFETSSPSYILMASAAKCCEYLEKNGKREVSSYEKKIDKFYEDCESLSKLKLLQWDNKDKGKLVISGEGYLLGSELFSILRDEYQLELEMAAGGYCIAMTSMMDTDEGFKRLKKALFEIDGTLKTKKKEDEKEFRYPKSTQVLSLKEAVEGKKTRRPVESALNCIAAGFVDFYPPGIPILAPGELITEEIVKFIMDGMERNLNVEGISSKGILIVE
ncbi:MAG: aminotransferase class V-fold PLP-dependent enzyme [Lachnospiraceae bacterium]|nr:aminotransferase class V-fold PLP-dependent enzyme [Lachnospiraceae bacterium]